MNCLQTCGLYPSQKIVAKISQPWQTRYDIATRVAIFAVCFLSVIGIVLMTLGFYQKVHPMMGVGILCSTVIPIFLICSLRAHGGSQLLAIYT